MSREELEELLKKYPNALEETSQGGRVVLTADWTRLTVSARREGISLPPFPTERMKYYIKDIAVNVLALEEPDEVIITNLPSKLSTDEALLMPEGTIVSVVGIVNEADEGYLFPEYANAICPSEDGEGFVFVRVYGDFLKGRPAEVPKKCIEPRHFRVPNGADVRSVVQGLPEWVTRPEHLRYIETYKKVDVQRFKVFSLPERGRVRDIDVFVYGKTVNLTSILGKKVEVVGTIKGKRTRGIERKVLMFDAYKVLSEEEAPNASRVQPLLDRLKKIPFPQRLLVLAVNIAPFLCCLTAHKLVSLLAVIYRPEKSDSDAVPPKLIHMLFAGDPETGKSSLMRRLAELVYPSKVVNAGSATWPGLTFSVDFNEHGQRVYRVGLIPLYSGGLLGIEELKTAKRGFDPNLLLDYLSSGRVSRSSAAGDIEITALTQIVSTTNPVNVRWDDQLSLTSNLSFLGEAFVSRFLVLVFRDRRDKMYRVYSLMSRVSEEELFERLPFTFDEMKVLVRYFRSMPNPKVSRDALSVLYDGLVESEDVPQRELNRIVMISQSIAKLDFSDAVKPEHMRLALTVYRLVTFVNTGSASNAGSSLFPGDRERRVRSAVLEFVRAKCDEQYSKYGVFTGIDEEDLYRHLTSEGIALSYKAFRDLLNSLVNEGLLKKFYSTAYGKRVYCDDRA